MVKKKKRKVVLLVTCMCISNKGSDVHLYTDSLGGLLKLPVARPHLRQAKQEPLQVGACISVFRVAQVITEVRQV